MLDLYGLASSGLPPEYQAGLRQSQQHQMMAQLLMDQAQNKEPVNQTAGGYVIPNSPLGGVNKILQAALGGYAMSKGASSLTDTANKFQADQNAAISKVQAAMAPRPAAHPVPLANADGVHGEMIERTIAEKRAAAQEAILNQNPVVRNFGTVLNSNLQAEQLLQSQQAFKERVLADNKEQRILDKELSLAETKRKEEIRKEERAQDFENQKTLKGMIAAGFARPDSVVVQTAEGTFGFDKRTKEVFPLMHDGKQLVGSTSDPSLQGQIASAKTGGEAKAKREYNMTGLGDTIQEAESILSGKEGALPTGSGLGAARDAVGGFFGVSTAGSVQAQKLKAMSGALTSKMPRMEGPQSDKDVQMYKEMAAEIGNPSVPVERRRAALETVKRLWAKYEPEASRPKQEGFDAGKEARYQAWKKSQGL